MNMFIIGLVYFLLGLFIGGFFISICADKAIDLNKCENCVAYKELMQNIIEEDNLEENSGEIKETN